MTSRCSRLRGAPKRHFGAGGGKAEGRFAALPVVASRAMRLGSTVATVGFPNVGLQGFAPKLARGEIAALSGAQDDARHFQINVPMRVAQATRLCRPATCRTEWR